ncbi:uracil-DNA glycosylase [Anatilimnocola floriformis]|uniref:uracil-DNA glycosylase n=1 Tax=Anatilimnocola floriformis TaxID=2948575 RepID=UPI0020C3FB51|nr:uracil-DNA glycosylase [Anatilimnocola floriformis]
MKSVSASQQSSWNQLQQQIVDCEKCARLREYCQDIARTKRKSYLEWSYWGKPVPNFGTAPAKLLIVGLAPAAHGANRTGRMFTGDRSGEWLYRALHRAGFANQSHSEDVNDGLRLIDCTITAMCHCAPPDNSPLPTEIAACQPWLQRTFELTQPRAVVALGGLAWRAVLDHLRATEEFTPKKLPTFAHAAEVKVGPQRWLVGSYHPSQQNTFTGRLTEEMLDAVFSRAKAILNS